MLPRLIDSWEALPRAIEAHLQERLWFDLKETYQPQSQAEMAKDVAAFANALGGAVIVGAKEGATEPDYSSPLSATYAAKIENEFDLAVRDFCRPSPTVHVRTIPVPTEKGKVIIVANIESFVDQPVAARHGTDKDMWRFPLRVGRHTEYLFPEQLPLYMNSKARRAKLLLVRVLDAGGEIDVFTVPSGSTKHANIQGASRYVLDGVDRDGGGAVVIRDPRGGQSVSIPIDDVEAVWLQHTGLWAVRLSGRIERIRPLDRSVDELLTYTPPTTFVVSPLGRVVDELSSRVREVTQALQGTLSVEHHARVEPNDDAIAERAFELWQARLADEVPGSAADDWFRARQQLLYQGRDR